MLDMGFIPDIEYICAKLPDQPPDAAVLGDDAAADQEAGRPVPDQSQVHRGRAPGHRPTSTSPSTRCSVASRATSATRCASCCATDDVDHRDRLRQPQDHGARAQQEPAAARLRSRARSTATWTSRAASPSSTGSRRARSTSSSPPTSPRAGSTSRASATSSTSTRRGTPTITSTASAAPAAPAPRAAPSRLVTPEDAEAIANVEKLTGIGDPGVRQEGRAGRAAAPRRRPKRRAAPEPQPAREERDERRAARASRAKAAKRARRASPRRSARRARSAPRRDERPRRASRAPAATSGRRPAGRARRVERPGARLPRRRLSAKPTARGSSALSPPLRPSRSRALHLFGSRLSAFCRAMIVAARCPAFPRAPGRCRFRWT